ncbi:LacI family DNA-binding transcriptional regulator [Clostridium sp. DJ247]|uniref:LacI family DNA-binding transcriptional regulator n=1 Tax=Clostridium sp. DJ247 TaxID=2726188 RepID=UPI0028BDB54B|nr:LacI family DNA-binding transcriptional regulator [Clostridium sp. DJ247]
MVIIININDVAKEAGVSKSTVSSVFSGKRPISKKVREHVLAVAKRLNYRPNYLARSLATKETKIIGLNMQGENVKFSQFHLSLLNGVLKVCYENGYRVLVNPLSQQYDGQIQFQTTDPIDGEILLDPSQNDERIIQKYEKNIPMVVIGRPQKGYEDKISYVDNDNVSIAAKLTDHLIEMGHTNILFLNSSEQRTVSQDRAKGYLEAFNILNLNNNSDYIVFKPEEMTSIEYGYMYTKKIISTHKDITAIIADSHKVAQGVYKGLQELDIAIPEDISVVAFSDDLESTLSPTLTCANLNSEILGEEAAKMLIELCKNKDCVVKSLTISSKLTLRRSTSNNIRRQV